MLSSRRMSLSLMALTMQTGRAMCEKLGSDRAVFSWLARRRILMESLKDFALDGYHVTVFIEILRLSPGASCCVAAVLLQPQRHSQTCSPLFYNQKKNNPGMRSLPSLDSIPVAH